MCCREEEITHCCCKNLLILTRSALSCPFSTKSTRGSLLRGPNLRVNFFSISLTDVPQGSILVPSLFSGRVRCLVTFGL